MSSLGLQEVQRSQTRLKRNYEMLDEQANDTVQDSITRYALNAALLAKVFHGPGKTPISCSGVLSKAHACLFQQLLLSSRSPIVGASLLP